MAQEGASTAQSQPTKAGIRIKRNTDGSAICPALSNVDHPTQQWDESASVQGASCCSCACSSGQLYAAQAWLLVIQSEFQSVEDRDVLISHVKAVAVESACHEPQTLGFQVR